MTGEPLQPWEIPPDESYWRALLADIDRLSEEPGSQDEIEAWLATLRSTVSVCAAPPAVTRPEPAPPAAAPATPPQPDALKADWQRARQLLESKERVELRVVGYNRGGLLVRFGQIQGFVPTSQLLDLPEESDSQARQAELARRVGQVLCLRVIEIDTARSRLIFSERAAVNTHEGAALLQQLAPGQVRRGLRALKWLAERLETLMLCLNQREYVVQPLFYHTAVLFEQLGCSYVQRQSRMEAIHQGFLPGGELRRRLDGSTPFRRPEQADSIRGRSWAIHDGILDQPWDRVRMVKRIGIHAGVNTCPNIPW